MSTDADAVREHARALSARRWDPAAQDAKAAERLIARADLLPASTRAQVVAALSEEASDV
jgi:hypothetical protein